MSPRIIQLPMSGRDRRYYVQQLHKAEQVHAALVRRIPDAYRIADEHLQMADRLLCEEWNARQFIGGDASPSPTIAQAIYAGCALLEVRCKRCGHESIVDLAEVVWPRQNPVHTLAKVLRCRTCKDERKRPAPDLVALRMRETPEPPVAARRAGR